MLTDAQVYCMTFMIYFFRPPLTAKAIYRKTEAKLHLIVKCQALLDSCATANFISERLAKYLKLPTCTLPISTINSMSTMTKDILRVTI